MTFDIHQLDNLEYEDAEPLIEDYIQEVVQQFAMSPEGQAYAEDYPDLGGWIRPFIELGYNYEGFTLPNMTVGNVEFLMESLLPRKIMVLDASEAEDAIPELAAFWSFLRREYNLRNAESIVAYLLSIKKQFCNWMVDPANGGMAKNFIMSGMEAGFDMTTQEGLDAFQQAYNAQLREEHTQGSFIQKLARLFGKPSSIEDPQLPTQKPSRKKPKPKNKGFGASGKTKSSSHKKK